MMSEPERVIKKTSLKRVLVIVDQSDPGTINGYSVFGPYFEATADEVMAEIDGGANTEGYNINSVIIAPWHGEIYKVSEIHKLLKDR